MTLQHIGLHMSVAPNGVEQVVLSDQFARTFGKTLQNSEGFWSKRYPFLSTKESLCHRHWLGTSRRNGPNWNDWRMHQPDAGTVQRPWLLCGSSISLLRLSQHIDLFPC